MRMYDLIEKKKHGVELSKEEITYIVEGFTKGEIPDYQMSAFLMAIYFQKMTMAETVALTIAMAKSGDQLDLSMIHGKKADKHSTGGVGDKTSLIIAPMLACLGVPVAKMSGRGLGHTGGTIDKLESFQGFQTILPEDVFIKNVNEMKFALVGQTANLAPADKKIYALRDVTATVDQISLIASSIMSKKLAAGADVIVLDVKTGSGAFMKTKEDAVKLAKTMVSIGTMAGKETIAVISDMNQPLGHMVGNSLEMREVIQVLNGNGEPRLLALSLELATRMLIGVGKASSEEEAKKMLKTTIEDKSALQKFAQFVVRQGGDENQVYDSAKLPVAQFTMPVMANQNGYIASCNTSEVGMASLVLGGGRETKESSIDLSVGIEIRKQIGDYVKIDEPIAIIYGNNQDKMEEAKKRILGAYSYSQQPVEVPPLIYEVIDSSKVSDIVS